MKIESAETILENEYQIQKDWSKVPVEAMKKYAAQFIDLAAEEVIKFTDIMNEPHIEKEVILNIKKQIK